MSIYTLLANDTARSGLRLDLVEPQFMADQEDGIPDIPQHPFIWTDSCPRPEFDCIPADLEQNLITAATEAANAVLKCPTGTMSYIMPSHEKYLRLLVESQKCIDTYKGRYDFGDALTDQISRYRTQVLFNIGTAMFHEALAHGWMDARHSHAVEKLAETAAFFDMILTAPYRKTSDRPELGPDNIRCMALLALGTAKEIEVAYLLKDAANVLDKVADTAFKACHFFRLLTTVAERTSSLPDYTSLLNFANIKRCFYEGFTYLLMSSDPDTSKGKSRRRKGQESFELSFGYANLHMPGERRQVETEIQTLIEQTINYRTLVRKNMIPFAQISSRKKRFFMCDEQFSNTERKAKLSFETSQRLQEIGELTEERAKNITGKSTQLSPEQKHKLALEESIGASVKETTPQHEDDDLIDIVLRTDHVNLLQRIAAVDAQKAEQKAEKDAAGASMSNKSPSQSITETAKAGSQIAAALAPFYYVQSLVKLQSHPDPADLQKTHNVAFVFVVDVTGIERPSAASVRELISLAVRFSLVGANDKIAVVVPLDGEDQFQVELVSGDEEGKKIFHEKLPQASKLRTASCQPSLVGAVTAARKSLDTLPRSFYKHVFVISDFGMRTMSSHSGNWAMFNKVRAPGEILGTVNNSKLSTGKDDQAEIVRVHSYAIAGDATSHLLRLMSENTKGDHGYWLKTNDISKDNNNFAQMRAWLVNILTMSKRTFARDIVVQVQNAGDSRIYDVASGHSKSIDQLAAKPQLHKDMCAVIPDLAHTFGGEVHVVCAIPPEACRQDVVHLGYAELRYTRADGSIRKVKMMLLNESNVSLIDRESFKWMQQLRLEGCEGQVLTKYEGGSFRQLKARGVETLIPRDTVVCKDGNVSLSSIEGATVEAGPVAEFSVDYVGTNEFNLHVEYGDYKIKTTSFGTCTLNIVDEYKIVIPENTMCRVDFTELPEGWTLSVKSIIGTVTIHTLSAQNATDGLSKSPSGAAGAATATSASAGDIEESASISAPAVPPILELQAPRVTMARLGDTPMQPWVGSEDGFLGWKPLAHRVAERVLALADIDMYHCRSACLPVMKDVTRWMQRRNRTGTIQPNTAARRCRKFLIWNRISNVRQQLANSSSQAIGGTEFAAIKSQLDVASQFSSPLRYEQISWEVVRNVNDAYRALETLRPAGSTSAFAPRDFEDQIAVLMNAREREAAERERIAREKEREVKNAEVRRRKELIALHFPLWDFEGDNEISVADAQTVFYDLPCRETPTIVKVYERWDRLISATTNKRAFNVEQFVTIMYTFTQDVDQVDLNKFFEQIGMAVKNVASLVDQSRIHRALFALFRWFDHDDNKGWVTMRRIATVIHNVFGDDAIIFSRIEDITKAAIDALNKKLPKNFTAATVGGSSRTPQGSRSASRNSDHQASSNSTSVNNASISSTGTNKEAEPVTLETLDAQRITLSTFIQCMLAFFIDMDEPSTHREIEMLFNHLFQKAKLPMDAAYVVDSENKRAERDRLMEWDLPHVFDGVRDKDLAKVLDPSWTPPANVNEICRAPCLILGLTKIKFNHVHKDDVKDVAEEYWKTLRKLLRTDSDSIFRYLKNFPPLSLSSRQIKVLSSSLENKDFDSHQLTKISPLFSALCAWTRIILRIGWLVHEWEKPKVMSDNELHKKMTMQLEIQQLQQARAAAEAAGINRHNSAIEAAQMHNGEFKNVYNTGEDASEYDKNVTKNKNQEFSSDPNALKQPGGVAMTPSKPPGGPSNQAPRRTSQQEF